MEASRGGRCRASRRALISSNRYLGRAPWGSNVGQLVDPVPAWAATPQLRDSDLDRIQRVIPVACPQWHQMAPPSATKLSCPEMRFWLFLSKSSQSASRNGSSAVVQAHFPPQPVPLLPWVSSTALVIAALLAAVAHRLWFVASAAVSRMLGPLPGKPLMAMPSLTCACTPPGGQEEARQIEWRSPSLSTKGQGIISNPVASAFSAPTAVLSDKASPPYPGACCCFSFPPPLTTTATSCVVCPWQR
jgi:hypothetical protein